MSRLPVFDLIWLRSIVNDVGWIPIQKVSSFSVFVLIQSIDNIGWMPIQEVGHFPFIIISWLTFLQAHDLAVFLNVYYYKSKSKNSGLPSFFKFMRREKFPVSSLFFFTGLMNLSFSLLLFIFLIAFLIPTGLLICMENTFWNGPLGPDNFVESFKQSFKLYVDSGMKKKVEAEIDILRNEQSESELPLIEDFRARFHKLIIDHYLRKIHCFYIHLTHLTTSFA